MSLPQLQQDPKFLAMLGPAQRQSVLYHRQLAIPVLRAETEALVVRRNLLVEFLNSSRSRTLSGSAYHPSSNSELPEASMCRSTTRPARTLIGFAAVGNETLRPTWLSSWLTHPTRMPFRLSRRRLSSPHRRRQNVDILHRVSRLCFPSTQASSCETRFSVRSGKGECSSGHPVGLTSRPRVPGPALPLCGQVATKIRRRHHYSLRLRHPALATSALTCSKFSLPPRLRRALT
jgi:hypothetical protein